MFTIAQLRAARALLGWSQDELAAKSGVSKPTIARLELGNDGEVGGYESTQGKLHDALKSAGVIFLAGNGDGPGVRLQKPSLSSDELARKIEAVAEQMPSVDPSAAPSPVKAMRQLERARVKNEITKLKNRRTKLKEKK